MRAPHGAQSEDAPGSELERPKVLLEVPAPAAAGASPSKPAPLPQLGALMAELTSSVTTSLRKEVRASLREELRDCLREELLHALKEAQVALAETQVQHQRTANSAEVQFGRFHSNPSNAYSSARDSAATGDRRKALKQLRRGSTSSSSRAASMAETDSQARGGMVRWVTSRIDRTRSKERKGSGNFFFADPFSCEDISNLEHHLANSALQGHPSLSLNASDEPELLASERSVNSQPAWRPRSPIVPRSVSVPAARSTPEVSARPQLPQHPYAMEPIPSASLTPSGGDGGSVTGVDSSASAAEGGRERVIWSGATSERAVAGKQDAAWGGLTPLAPSAPAEEPRPEPHEERLAVPVDQVPRPQLLRISTNSLPDDVLLREDSRVSRAAAGEQSINESGVTLDSAALRHSRLTGRGPRASSLAASLFASSGGTKDLTDWRTQELTEALPMERVQSGSPVHSTHSRITFTPSRPLLLKACGLLSERGGFSCQFQLVMLLSLLAGSMLIYTNYFLLPGGGISVELPLAATAVVGLLVTGADPKVRDCYNLLLATARRNGSLDRWVLLSKRDATFMLLIWSLSVAAKAGMLIPSLPELPPGLILLQGGVFALIGLFITAFLLLLQHMVRALLVAVDRFCWVVVDHSSIPEASEEWNMLAAVLRKVSGSIGRGFILALVAMIFTLSFGALWIVTNLEEYESSRIALPLRVLPSALLLVNILFVLKSAAGVTEKCKRVPALINSMSFGPGTEDVRAAVVEYVSYSAAGFYVYNGRFNMEFVLKLGYIWFVGTASLAMRVFDAGL